MTETGSGDQLPGKIYVSNDKIRMEQKDGHAGAVIIDGKAGTAFVLIPARKLAMDVNQGGHPMQSLAGLDPDNPCPQLQKMEHDLHKNEKGEWSCKRIGPETVNGRTAVKIEGTSPAGEQSFGWIDTRLKFLIKSQSAKGAGLELRNIQEGPQPASLFEIPADYQKMDPQAMQRMMQQRATGGAGGGAPGGGGH